MAIYGAQPYGPGTPAVAPAANGRLLRDPITGLSTGARRLDPVKRDYVIDPATGTPLGMTNAQQLVLLAIRTVKGSAVARALGNELKTVKRITSNIERRVDNLLRAATASLVARGIIEVLGVSVARVAPTAIAAQFRWRDLATGKIETTSTTLNASGG